MRVKSSETRLTLDDVRKRSVWMEENTHQPAFRSSIDTRLVPKEKRKKKVIKDGIHRQEIRKKKEVYKQHGTVYIQESSSREGERDGCGESLVKWDGRLEYYYLTISDDDQEKERLLLLSQLKARRSATRAADAVAV